eukprot:TRINITY_DN501_c0_g1_i1.p1 TRINITY_DN501_c0_g1~~TRINITY_DN501_c0_g1_i1.p1  ORF type:complete len:412 (+),score=97.42 TRINITY_DN501_c0_g1_i1:71-1237(+)
MSLQLLFTAATGTVSKNLAPTPPMGWMNWEIFRCQTDCSKYNESCINEYLFTTMTDRLVSDGYLAAGYEGIHIDDCWMRKNPERDPQGKLFPDPERFPHGFKWLGEYMHNKSVKFAIYTAESPHTCAGYPASADHEVTDADTFAEWGVDYVKVDGCGDKTYYPTGYPAMGNALVNSGRDIVYSCSWPAYLGSNESSKPYTAMAAAHCNLWRNWADIQCNWNSLSGIIEHWGQWGSVLRDAAKTGAWNDPDMLLIGNDCITADEARTQMALWSISAAPLIMGNDLRIVPDSHKEILLNKEAIAIDQDSLGVQGIRVQNEATFQVWTRPLANGDVAYGLYNPTSTSQTVRVTFDSESKVRDIWEQKDLGSFTTYSTTVPSHGTAFLRVSK